MSNYFYRAFHRLPSLLLLAVLSQQGISQPDTPALEYTDHSLLSKFPYSEIVERELLRDINHSIILGSLERVRGEVIPEESERVRGDVTKINYEISDEFSGEDVYQFFQEQLDERGYELLFECEGRGCGSSNYWANDIFRNRILYGPEANQFYLAFRGGGELERAPYFSLYIITRVNRRIYAYIEIVEPDGTQELEQSLLPVPQSVRAEGEILRGLRDQGSVVLPAIDFQTDDTLPESLDLSETVAALSADPSLSVYLVAHLTSEGESLEVLMRRSSARASALREALIGAGIDPERIEAAGIGPLAPSCASANCTERVELVLR